MNNNEAKISTTRKKGKNNLDTKQSLKHPFDVLKLFFFKKIQSFIICKYPMFFTILFSHVIRHSFIVFKVEYDSLLAVEVIIISEKIIFPFGICIVFTDCSSDMFVYGMLRKYFSEVEVFSRHCLFFVNAKQVRSITYLVIKMLRYAREKTIN